jgi:uncharacterized membrane protein YfcA
MNMHDIAATAQHFISLDTTTILYLFLVGFVGGLVSGFIGSGGAFVLTPAMMSLGVPGLVAVASNMCHKFPKALVGAIKRAKYGQVDVKFGIIYGIFAEFGVMLGAALQEYIKEHFGDAGSNLYVSVAFVVVLGIVGTFVLLDAFKTLRSGQTETEEKVTRLARWVQSVRIPGTMVYFKSIQASVSLLFVAPFAFLTGMMAATIAVGGFLGVPSMIYVFGAPSLMASATELVVAFVMGLGGSFKFALHGLVDIRLAMIILAGSLFGIQLGAIGTTYVKPFAIKMVMGVIMVIVLFSRALMVPVYLSELQCIASLDMQTIDLLKNVSFIIMAIALLIGAGIVLFSMWAGQKRARKQAAEAEALQPSVSKA